MTQINLAERIEVLFIGATEQLGAVFAFADWGGRRGLEECLPFPDEPDNWMPIYLDRWQEIAPEIAPPPYGWLATCFDVRNAFGADTFTKMVQHPDAYAAFLVKNLRSLRSAWYSPEKDRVYLGELARARP
jgi:hypothetical protein